MPTIHSSSRSQLQLSDLAGIRQIIVRLNVACLSFLGARLPQLMSSFKKMPYSQPISPYEFYNPESLLSRTTMRLSRFEKFPLRRTFYTTEIVFISLLRNGYMPSRMAMYFRKRKALYLIEMDTYPK
jgi:hypothetical protein